jgi:hypothetical protein
MEVSVNSGSTWGAATPNVFTAVSTMPSFASPVQLSGFTNDQTGIRMRVRARWTVSGVDYDGPDTSVFTCDNSGNNGNNPTTGHDSNDLCQGTIDKFAPNRSLSLVN